MTNWQEVWRRLLQGQHTVVEDTAAPPPPSPLRLLVIDCEAFALPRGTLDEACRLLRPYRSSLTPSLVDEAAARLRSGLRQRLLGETELASELARYRQALSEPRSEPQLALFLRGVDRADAASIALLQRLIDSADAPLPLLLGFSEREPAGAARALLEHLSRLLPREAFCWPPAGARADAPAAAQLEPAWQRLSPAALRVLRAAVTVGDRFESEVLALLLGMDQLEVLGLLQEAADQGLPLEDRGQGVFRCGAEAAAALRRTTLPSLARAWHERLAQLLGGLPAPLPSPSSAEAAPDVSALATSSYSASNPVPQSEPQPQPVAAEESPPSQMDQLLEVNRQGAEDWQDPRQSPWWQRLEQDLAAPPGTTPPPSSASERALRDTGSAAPVALGSDGQRAAQHAEAAGLWHLASAQHLAAAEEQCLRGAPEQALAHVQQASLLAARVTDAEQRRRLRITGLVLEGRSRWECPSSSPEASLPAALRALLECRELLDERDPPGLRAEVGRLIASVQYDIGTAAALESALRELTAASQLLLASGQPVDAACLLNDEAAVWVKLGDPVRAHHLLSRSREVFSKVLGSHPHAQLELAETEHLLASLLLQASARPGRERDALQLGIEHGRAAAEAYASLDQPRALARVHETLARLELRLGHVTEAARLLELARQAQLQLGDDVGRARSSAAAVEVHASERNYAGALERLGESIALNAAKGLRAGLQHNLASLQRLEQELPGALQPASRALRQQLLQTLEQ